ncbi:hypothetical protein NP233_g12875 [Leucocoprinus birnbaumii]|uniref:Uncharacterized protein n=1 Tax=Leucocoprinus birnbaumii TaxID=56174 RepID=A0AAD5VFM9_9AGAR|nr:hypothetical protein NP233_g12875 [Leucocoprinus birnbaumii]
MSHGLILFFDATVLLGAFLIICILVPAILSTSIHRSIGWYSMMAAWLMYSSSYALLIGLQEGEEEPPRGICLAQTLFIYPAPVLAASATLCYYVEFYSIVSGLKCPDLAYAHSPSAATRRISLAVIPWILWLLTICEVSLVILSGDNVSLLERAEHRFYCHLRLDAPWIVSAVLDFLMALAIIILQVKTGLSMYRHWHLFKRLTQTDREVLVTIYIRFIYCTVAGVFTSILCAVALAALASPKMDCLQVLYPVLPIMFALSFGTQKDLRQTWLFWRKPEPYTSIVFHHHTLSTTQNLSVQVQHEDLSDSSGSESQKHGDDLESEFSSMSSKVDFLQDVRLVVGAKVDISRVELQLMSINQISVVKEANSK